LSGIAAMADIVLVLIPRKVHEMIARWWQVLLNADYQAEPSRAVRSVPRLRVVNGRYYRIWAVGSVYGNIEPIGIAG
jgi:hypothetical protein